MMPSADDVLFEYVWQANPKSNDELKRFLRLYPEHRDEIIEFTATWRALSILERVLPPAPLDLVEELQLLRYAKAQLRFVQRRRARTVRL
jgi:ribonuclease D